jgi:hypothetical protein
MDQCHSNLELWCLVPSSCTVQAMDNPLDFTIQLPAATDLSECLPYILREYVLQSVPPISL